MHPPQRHSSDNNVASMYYTLDSSWRGRESVVRRGLSKHMLGTEK